MAAITLQIIPYGGVHGTTVSSIFGEQVFARQRGHTLRLVNSDGDSLLPRRRSIALSSFYERTKDDVIVTVDHDVAWRPGGVVAVAERALELDAIVGGLYSKRAYGQGFSSRMISSDKPIQIPSNEHIKAQWVGSGFMAIPRCVVKKMVEDPEKSLLSRCWDGRHEYWSFYHTMMLPHPERPDLMEYVSEDWAVCERARRVGTEIYVDLRPVIIHHGDVGFNVGDAVNSSPQAQPSTPLR
jgi:hypothetical protein